MQIFTGRTALITGAASGFGLEFAKTAAARGMNLVMVDVQQPLLDNTAAELAAQYPKIKVMARVCDVADVKDMAHLHTEVKRSFGAVNLLFNNAGVAAGGFVWENTMADWNWVMGVNLWGVAHGVREFVPDMLAAAKADPSFEAHIINTASMAGLLNAPISGIYNVTKSAVVALSETLYQDLRLVTEQVHCSVLCPYFVPTGISTSHRNRPDELAASKATASQLVSQANAELAVSKGKVSAAEVIDMVFAAIESKQFYIYSHPNAMAPVQTRMEDILLQRNPTDPFAVRPEIGAKLRAALAA